MPAIQKWQMRSRVEDRKARKAEQAKTLAEAVAHVRRRESDHCRICGRYVKRLGVSSLESGDVHHVTYRSRGGGHYTSNLILVCKVCHADIHAGKVRVEGDADQALTIWRRGEGGEWHVWIQEDGMGGTVRD